MVEKNVKYCMATTLIASLLIISIGCSERVVPGYGPAVTGSGLLETQEMDYSDFNNIAVGSAFEIYVARSNSYSVSITMDDNLFEHLQIDQHADTLYIGLATNRTYVRAKKKATITLPTLHRLELSGSSQAEVESFSASDAMEFDLSGASEVDIENVKAGDARFKISGASHISGDIEIDNGRFKISGGSTIELEGSATDIYVDASGASSLRLSNFSVIDADITLSGASRATIDASGRLDAGASGASKLYYVGNPTLGSIRTSSGSTINQK